MSFCLFFRRKTATHHSLIRTHWPNGLFEALQGAFFFLSKTETFGFSYYICTIIFNSHPELSMSFEHGYYQLIINKKNILLINNKHHEAPDIF